MEVSAILLAVIVGVGLVLYVHHRLTGGDAEPADVAQAAVQEADETECCGMHITCEKDSLVAGMDSELLYYDDEELDAFRGRGAGEYSAAEVEQFREVLLTLRPDEIAGWARSITTRGITLPHDVRDELLLIVAEARAGGM